MFEQPRLTAPEKRRMPALRARHLQHEQRRTPPPEHPRMSPPELCETQKIAVQRRAVGPEDAQAHHAYQLISASEPVWQCGHVKSDLYSSRAQLILVRIL